MLFDDFNILILKIKKYFNIFLSKKLFKKILYILISN